MDVISFCCRLYVIPFVIGLLVVFLGEAKAATGGDKPVEGAIYRSAMPRTDGFLDGVLLLALT